MQVFAEHEFEAPLGRVLESLVRPEYASYLAAHHSFFREVEMLAMEPDAGAIRRRVRYCARPPFSHLGPVSIPKSWFVWTEWSQLDLRTHVLTFENVPELESIRAKVVNRGQMTFRALSANRCARSSVFEIDLVVSRSVRPLVELGVDLVAKQVAKSLDAEANVLNSWLTDARPSSLAPSAQRERTLAMQA